MIKNIQLITLLLLLHFFATAQSTYNVTVSNFQFVNNSLVIDVGDQVIWTNTAGTHNVNGSMVTFPANPQSFTSGAPASGAWVYNHTFTIPGVYNYRCDPHAAFGMTGNIIVNAIALPIELANFVCAVNKSNVLVEWKTENEVQAKTFILERSKNANVYETIYTTSAHKTSFTYNYTDNMGSTKQYFYRLKIINEDNSVQYSPVRLISNDIKTTEDKIVISPNPSYGHFHITCNAKNKYNADISLMDIYGNKYITLTDYIIEEGSNYIHMGNTENLNKGIYLIVITNTKTKASITAKAIKL